MLGESRKLCEDLEVYTVAAVRKSDLPVFCFADIIVCHFFRFEHFDRVRNDLRSCDFFDWIRHTVELCGDSSEKFPLASESVESVEGDFFHIVQW